MTDEDKKMITAFRQTGMGYKLIAGKLNLSLNSVKSFCRRNNLLEDQVLKDTDHAACEQCGTLFKKIPGRKKKRFCSDRCRNMWWNSHLDQVKRKAVYELNCRCCGKAFLVYGNAGRKFCSHECYVRSRFGGANNE